MQSQALQKRIKRHVIGPDHLFFIATEPHLTRICHNEFTSILPDVKDAKIVTGGLEFSGRLTDCYRANLSLRTANRVLMRMAEFKATNFLQLEKKINNIPWELYLAQDSGIQVNVSIQKSRLYHKDAVKEHITTAILKQMPDLSTAPFGQQIFVRGIEDRFTVSIDSSGDLLYKRGIKSYGHKAPLRETLAAAALILSDYQPEEPLVDPMCGSGTFSLEAALMAKDIPPGWFRQFAFMNWPAFKPNQWEFLKKEVQKEQNIPPNPSIFASDTDEVACENIKKALESSSLADVIQVQKKDFFSFYPSDVTPATGLVAINPPYGVRLESPKKSELFFKSIIQLLKANYNQWKFILIVPYEQWLNLIPVAHKTFPILHGGRRVYIAYGKLRN